MERNQTRATRVGPEACRAARARGFTLPELAAVVAVIMILVGISAPSLASTLSLFKVRGGVSAISAAIQSTRYRAIMTSQIYTIAFTAPADSYVITNVGTATASNAVPLPGNRALILNGGVGATYTFTLCPDGTVNGSAGTCPNATAVPALSVAYQTRQVNINVSSAGSITTTFIH